MKNNLECILCKYKKNPQKCAEKIHTPNWHCPTLQNIFYGKLVDYYPFKIFYKIQKSISHRKASKFYDTFNTGCTENEDYKFIVGAISYDNIGSNTPNLLTMNDLEVLYNKKNRTYSWDVEAAYHFENLDGKKKYLKRLLKVFTKYMKENGYDTNLDGFHTIATHSEYFDTLEECYANFKYCVNGYINS